MAKFKIENKKIADYLEEKNTLVNEGRKISQQIEDIDKEIEKANEQERKVTEIVEPKELIAKGNALQEEINAKINELEKIGDEIMKIKLAAIPKDMMDNHYALRTKKEEKERERNKVALKVQKIKDRVAPLVKKLIEPLLAEYEDTETVEVVKGSIIIKTFSHLDEFKKRYNASKRQ